MTPGAELLAVVAALVAVAGAILRTWRGGAVGAVGLGLLVASWAGMLLSISPTRILDRWPAAVAAIVVLGVLLLLVARFLVGRERWIIAAGAAVLTLRVPVPTGDDTAMLLGPLYLVIAVGAAARMRVELGRRQLREGTQLAVGTRLLDIGAMLTLLVAAASVAWSVDREASAVTLGCFLIPFAITYWLVRSWLEDRISLRPAAIALVASAVLAAAIGLYQAAAREVWWNPKVIEANGFRADFRVNSLYWDPNIFGRALVVAACLLVAWLLVERTTRATATAALVCLALLVLALWNTYSQSSWVALAGALVLVAILTLPPRARRWTAGALAIVVLVAAPTAYRALAGSDASGRATVVRAGIALAADRPIVGHGVGTFETALVDRAERLDRPEPELTASHTTPVTVAAELGIAGGLAYLVMLTVAGTAVLARWRGTSTPASAARAGGDAHATGWPSAAVVWASAALAALVAHSLLYAGFHEDATLWVTLALLAGLPRPAAPTQ